jgi:S-adenosylmethionine:tRNA ribosyltransferase-isomerase
MRLALLVECFAHMQRTDFYFDLPPDRIAQRPAAARSASRMLLLDAAAGLHRDMNFRDLPALLSSRDLLVFNDTRVIPARIFGVKESGGRVEILLERALAGDTALVHLKASKGLRVDAVVKLPGGEQARMLGRRGELFHLQFSCAVVAYFEANGEMPLPPYIARPAEGADRERYQTVYARHLGAIAAPTAGLHFDEEVFAELETRAIRRAFVTLHVGAGTFQPVRVDDIEGHEMHEEYLTVPAATCDAIKETRAMGGRVIAIGTTVVRSLETAANGREVAPFSGSTRIFIKPGHRFRAVDAMVTNFHLPESTLLMLCAAFVGRETLLAAYAHAVRERYRFFSYGDAMFLLPAGTALERS